MRIRKVAVAIATAASLLVVPTAAFATGGASDGCRDSRCSYSYNDCSKDKDKWRDYKYAPPCQPKCDDDKCDHRDHDRDRDKEKKVVREVKTQKKAPSTSYDKRVLKTD